MKGVRRLTYALLTLFLSLTTLFFIMRMAPGDPVERILGPEAHEIDREILREQLGLNLNLTTQYGNFLKGIPTGDFGKSLFKSTDVSTLIWQHLPPTLIIAFVSVAMAFFIGTTIGIYAGAKKSRWEDSLIRVLSLLTLSFPIFSLAPLFVLLFAIYWQLFPVSEWGEWKHAFLPILSLVVPLSSVIIRVGRNRFLEECQAPWVTVLAAKGLSERAILLRLTKACLPTLLNVVAIQLSVVLAGTMITETIFDIPGIGMLLFESIQNRDFPVVQGIIAYSTTVYMLVYFLIDALNSWIDPRIEI